jgi:BirA family biotin operon repressor/biotin-[acetyl-CoA-carboxylase] ligase
MTGNELSETAVQPLLTTRWIGHAYHYLERVGSTNDLLLEMVATADEQRPPGGTVIVTDYQSAGRGRMKREWAAPPGTSLLFSILFRPGWPAEQGMWLMMLGSLAAAEAIESVAHIPTRLKWPNDLLVEVDGTWRKLGGLLLETQLNPSGNVTTAVLGIGINVNQSADQLPAAIYPPTSLRLASGRPLSRLALLIACLTRLEWHYDAAAKGGSPYNAWRNRLITLGKMVTVSTTGSTAPLEGVAEDVDQWGRLLIRDQAGQKQAIAAGDVIISQRD